MDTKVNALLSEVIDNFFVELSNHIEETTCVADLLDTALEYCYLDNYIGSYYNDDNKKLVQENGYDISRLPLYILEEIGADAVDILLNGYKDKGITRYVLDVHYWALYWLMDEYELTEKLTEALKAQDAETEFEISECSLDKIKEIFNEALEEHGDNELF